MSTINLPKHCGTSEGGVESHLKRKVSNDKTAMDPFGIYGQYKLMSYHSYFYKFVATVQTVWMEHV